MKIKYKTAFDIEPIEQELYSYIEQGCVLGVKYIEGAVEALERQNDNQKEILTRLILVLTEKSLLSVAELCCVVEGETRISCDVELVQD
jgi:hypothetical protein